MNDPQVAGTAPSSAAGGVGPKAQENKDENIEKSRDLSINDEFVTIQKNTLANVVSGADKNSGADKRKHQKQNINRKSKYKEMDKELKLSSVTKDVSLENDRQKKISCLPAEKLQELHEKRKELEQSYKQDCDTFATVVKMLISKDPSMEDKLLSSLRDSLKDIGQKFITELNEFVDTLLLTE